MKPFVLLIRISVLFIAGISTVASQTLPLKPLERLPTPVVDPASDDARRALTQFSLPKGLKASLWAAEPMLANPVAIDFDEKGRLFVSETYRYRTSVLDIRDYMEVMELDMNLRSIEDRAAFNHNVFGDQAKDLAIESEIVRLVEDTDHDGVADKSSIYADGFNSELDGIAAGVLARHGQVWFTNIPSLWLLEGDAGKVRKTELLRGFGVRYSLTGHDFHGLALGHDGKLYFSIGDRGMNVMSKEGRRIAYPDEGGVYRSNLDGTELELVHRGLRNPQELVFDEHGNLFTGDNDSDLGDQERLVYVVEGGESGWRVGYQQPPLGGGGPWVSEGLWKPQFAGRPAYLLPPVCNIEDGPSGLTYYPGTGLTPEYAGHFFITHFRGSIARSGIQTYTVKQNGATFAPTSSQQFMGGVLPTDVTFGPDGKLYIADWVSGWPKSQKGRIYGISPVNPDPAQAKASADLAKLLASGFTQRSEQELVALLAHPDRRARLEAQLELAARGGRSVAAFAKIANDRAAAPLARLHAVWGLTQLGRKPLDNGKPDSGLRAVYPTLNALLADSDPEVRAQSAKGLGDIHGIAARRALERALTKDPESRVKFFAAQSLGKFGNPASAEPLIALLRANDNKDAYLRFAAANALSKLGAGGTLAKAAKDPSAAVRLGVLLSYRISADPAISVFLQDRDAFIVREAAEAINDAPIELSTAQLADKLASAPPADSALVLRSLNASYRLGGASRAVAIANYALDDRATPDMRAEALKQLALWGKVPQRDRLVGIYRTMNPRPATDAIDALAPRVSKLIGDGVPKGVQLAAIDALGALKLTSAAPVLISTVGNEKSPEAVRTSALETLDAFDDGKVLDALSAAERSSVPSLRLTALQIVARRSPERAMPVITRYATSGSEAEQQAAFHALGEMNSPLASGQLISGLDQLAAGKVRPGAQVELLDAVSKSTAPEVKARWEKTLARWAADKNPLAPYSFALEGGDVSRGSREFFENQVLPCARCHRVGAEGGEAGPELTRIGTRHPAEYLLEAVVKPSAHFAPGFDLVTFTLANGSTESGSVAEESASGIVLKRGDGSQITLDPRQVKQRVVAPSSMPEMYGQVLTRTQLRDVVAFLKALDGSLGRGGAPPEKTFGTSNRAMQSVVKEEVAGGHP